MKIGILGGTFDPVHLGHTKLAQAAMQQFALDEIWMMPAKIPPHKQNKQIASEEHRIEMLKIATKELRGFRVCSLEFERDEVSYTAETLQLLKGKYPEWQFFYLMGEDSLFGFCDWYHPKEIVANAELLVAPRAGGDNRELLQQIELCERQFGKHFFVITTPWIPVSSTEIRKHIKAGESTENELHPGVRKYIDENKLYKDGSIDLSEDTSGHDFSKVPGGETDISEISARLKASLSPKRYLHTQGVAYTAAALAMRYGVSVTNALLAGWLHDNAKENPGGFLLKVCQENNMEVSPSEYSNLQLLHGKVGAFFAERDYGITDKEILSAIRYHVTGRRGMSLLEQIIYVADYIEPSRKMKTSPELSEIRRMAFIDIDRATMWIAEGILCHLKKTDTVIDMMTKETFDFYKNKQLL